MSVRPLRVIWRSRNLRLLALFELIAVVLLVGILIELARHQPDVAVVLLVCQSLLLPLSIFTYTRRE